MSRNVVKFFYAAEQENSKIIDSNGRMEQRLKEIEQEWHAKALAQARSEQNSGEEGDDFSEGFVEGLGAEELDSLLADGEDGGNVIKAVNPEEEAEAIRAEAQAKADEIVATAEQLAQEYKENTRRETDIECSRMRANARQEGYDEGIQQARDEYADRFAALEAKERDLIAELEATYASLESRFVDTITGIYEHIFNVDLVEYQPLVAQLVASTMHRVEMSKSYIVHVSAEDYPGITGEQKELLEASAPGCNVDIVEDIGLTRNQCLLETDNGVFDCGLDTQLRELRRKLMLLSYSPE